MAKDIAVTESGNFADVLAGLANIMKTAQSNAFNYLQFSGKEGRFKYRDGDNDVELPLGSRLLVDQNHITHGHKCWKNDDIVDSYESECTKPLPSVEDMEDHGPYDDDRDGWQTFIAVMLKDPETDKTYRMEISSVSGRKSLGEMIKQIFEKAPLHKDENKLKGYAVVELGAVSFKSKGFKNYKPVLSVVDWDEDASMAPPSVPGAVPALAGPDTEEEEEVVAAEMSVPKSRKK